MDDKTIARTDLEEARHLLERMPDSFRKGAYSAEIISDAGRTHFADDATLQHISELEARVKELEAERGAIITVRDMLRNKWAAATEQLTASRAQLDRLVEALNKVKTMVCGEAAPHWAADIQTTFSRGHVADICDEALAAVEKEHTA